MLLVTESLQISQRLEGLPACGSLCSLDWLSPSALLVCTDEGCVHWDLAATPSPARSMFGRPGVCSAACSADGQRLALGTAEHQARMLLVRS